MKNVYIGKKSVKSETATAICKVIDTDIATGDAIVYNRETNTIEILHFSEKIALDSNLKKLAEDTEKEYTNKIKKAFEKYLK